MQLSLEEAFLKTTNGYSYRIAGQDNEKGFLSPSDVSQTNLGNETARKLRRRPAKVVSRDDILALKRYVRNTFGLELGTVAASVLSL